MVTKLAKQYLKVAKLYYNNLKKEILVERAMIFGSLAKGEINEDSDIDIIILSEDFNKMDFLKRHIFLSRQRKGICRKVPMDIFGYTPKEFEKLCKESIVFREAVKEGTVIK